MINVYRCYDTKQQRQLWLWFADNYLRFINPSVEFESKMLTKPISKILSISDEAFAIMLVENYYEDEYVKRKASYPPGTCGPNGETMRKQAIAFVNKNSSPNSETHWNDEAKAKFNFWCEQIADARKDGGNLHQRYKTSDQHYMTYVTAEINSKKRRAEKDLLRSESVDGKGNGKNKKTKPTDAIKTPKVFRESMRDMNVLVQEKRIYIGGITSNTNEETEAIRNLAFTQDSLGTLSSWEGAYS